MSRWKCVCDNRLGVLPDAECSYCERIEQEPVETVSPKSLDPDPWQVAIRALGGDYSPLARKIGGRRDIEPLSIAELGELRRALRPFVYLADEVEQGIASEVLRLEEVGARLADACDSEDPSPAAPEPYTTP